MQIQVVQKKIHEIRNQKVMLDFDLAELYKVETKILNKAVKRNLGRFPNDFMFRLTTKEWKELRFQFGTSKGRGGTRYPPHAFTEQGVSMLSAILNSKKAIDVSVAIIRAFVLLRKYSMNYTELKEQIRKLEKEMNRKFKDVYEALNYLLHKDKLETDQKDRKRIGYK